MEHLNFKKDYCVLSALRQRQDHMLRHNKPQLKIPSCDTEGFLESSYRKLARVRFEPTTCGFRSDDLTNWAIRPWVQVALRANFVQLLQFHLFVQRSRFISKIKREHWTKIWNWSSCIWDTEQRDEIEVAVKSWLW